MTDAAALTTGTYTYDAFGNLIAQTGATQNSYLYTGEQYDPNTGFYYLRARYYNPSVGRFLNRDTYAGSPWEPQTLHKYVYTHNNPINGVDPSGHETLLNLNISSAIVGRAVALSFAAIFAAKPRAISALTVAAYTHAIATGASAVEAVEGAIQIYGPKRKVRDMIDSAIIIAIATAEALRRLKVVPIPRKIIPNVAYHVAYAQSIGHPIRLRRVSSSLAKRIRRQDLRRLTGGAKAGPGLSWDEYPFASGRPLEYARDPSVQPVPAHENFVQGGIIAGSYLIQSITVDTEYIVVVIP